MMKLFFSLNEMFANAREAFKRFPISTFWAISGTFYVIWFIEQKIYNDSDFHYVKLILTFIVGLSWLIATRLLTHYYIDELKKNKSWLSAIPLLLLFFYYLSLPDESENFDSVVVSYRFVLFLFAGHLAVLFMPFIHKWNKYAYWNYLKDVFIAFFGGLFFSAVLYLGLVLAMLALTFLFNFEIKGERYFELFIFCLGVVNTWIFLTRMPKNIYRQATIEYPKTLATFVKYILIPLTILYLIILYVYGFKILVNWNLPKGWVSYLIIALSALGFLIHILINPVRKTIDSSLIKKFYPWFYYALFPMLLLLFVAILKRVLTYGITENRYLVLVIALWISGMTSYILFSKRKKLRCFFVSLTLLSLLISFGFWGVFSISLDSQTNRFEKLFYKMQAKNFKIKYKEKEDFESILTYLAKRNSLDRLRASLGYNPAEEFEGLSQWKILQKVSDKLHFELIDENQLGQKRSHFYYHLQRNTVLNIQDYDYFKSVILTDLDGKLLDAEKNCYSIKDYRFTLDMHSGNMIRISKNDSLIYRMDLNPLLDSLNRKQGDNIVSQTHFSIEKEYKDCRIKLIFKNLQLKVDEKDKTTDKIIWAEAYVLLKIKK